MKKRPRTPPSTWKAKLESIAFGLRRQNRGATAAAYIAANLEAILRTVSGHGPDPSTKEIDPRAGARVVVNISSVHIPAICAASMRKELKPYKNAYDLDELRPANGGGGSGPSSRRRLADAALPLPAGQMPEDTYFGALEINGAGIRFYGDMCLALKKDCVAPETLILDRNSYEIMRSPACVEIDRLRDERERAAARRVVLHTWKGMFGRDAGTIAAIKVLTARDAGNRRLTTGQISSAIREDEDYIEILRHGSFSTHDLQEARITSGEAAQDALVASRLQSSRPAPRLEAIIWRDRRSEAERALRAAGVAVKVVTTDGRVKG